MATSVNAAAVDCPECGGRPEHDGTERVCADCGLVLDESPIDHGPDYRNFDDEIDRRHDKPGNKHLPDRGLGSEVGQGSERDHRADRLQMWQSRTKRRRKKDRNRGYATTEIHRLCSALDLSDSLKDQAKTLFEQLHERDLMEGQNMDAVTAACVYATCRIHQRGLTTDDVGEYARADAHSIARRYNWAVRELELACPPPKPKTRIRVVASELDADEQTTKRALWLCDRMDDRDRTRGQPSSLAAACLYQAGDWTQAEVAEAAGVTPTTIRARCEDVPSLEAL